MRAQPECGAWSPPVPQALWLLGAAGNCWDPECRAASQGDKAALRAPEASQEVSQHVWCLASLPQAPAQAAPSQTYSSLLAHSSPSSHLSDSGGGVSVEVGVVMGAQTLIHCTGVQGGTSTFSH